MALFGGLGNGDFDGFGGGSDFDGHGVGAGFFELKRWKFVCTGFCDRGSGDGDGSSVGSFHRQGDFGSGFDCGDADGERFVWLYDG